jgi:hypothetical protein
LKVRETIVFDPYKEVPEEVKAFDLKKKNQKKRYELRYTLEQQYRDQGVDAEERAREIAVNRYNGEKFYEEALKGYDNLTLEKTDLGKYEETAYVKPKMGLWQKIQASKEPTPTEPEPLMDMRSPTEEFNDEIGFVKTKFPTYVHAEHCIGEVVTEQMQQTAPATFDRNDSPAIEDNGDAKPLDAVDAVYENMLKEQHRKREMAEGCGIMKFEPFHKDLRKVKSHSNSAGFGGSASTNHARANTPPQPAHAENFVGFDSMNMAGGNKENLNYGGNPDPAPVVNHARPQFEKFKPEQLISGTEMNPLYKPEEATIGGAGRRASEKTSEKSEKFNNCEPKDTFQGALRDNRNNFINNEDRNLVTNVQDDTHNDDRKSFYSTSSRRSRDPKRITIHSLNRENEVGGERAEKITVKSRSTYSGTSGPGKFPSIKNGNIYGSNNAYEPSMNTGTGKPPMMKKSRSSVKPNSLVEGGITSGGFN